MNKIEQARRSIETAMARIGCPPGDNADADLYRDLQRSLAILKDMEAQEPVAWMTEGNERQFMWSDHKILHTRHDNKDVREYLNEKYCIPLYTHPSPSAPVDIAEVIAAGNAMANWIYEQDEQEDVTNAWTTATAKHRTA